MLKDVIIVSRGQRLSVFSTLSKAYELNGWGEDNYKKDRTKPLPYMVHGVYKVQKVPAGVTISCFELLETISAKSTVQQWTKDGGKYIVSVHAYSRSYDLEVEYDTKHEPADYHNGDRGREEVRAAYDYDVPTAITSAAEMCEDGPKKILLDKWTEEQLLNYINLGQ